MRSIAAATHRTCAGTYIAIASNVVCAAASHADAGARRIVCWRGASCSGRRCSDIMSRVRSRTRFRVAVVRFVLYSCVSCHSCVVV